MSGRLFSLDAATKSVEKFHWDPVTEEFTIEDKQNVEGIVEANQHDRSEGVNKKAFARLVGRVPENIYWYWQTKWQNEGRSREEIRKAWVEFLNNPDNKDFKTIDGRV